MLKLEKENSHPRDKHIRFEEEGHRYFIDEDDNYLSGTSLIHKLFPAFNADEVIDRIKKLNRNDKYKDMKMVELGCCQGDTTKVFSSLFKEVYAYDWSEENIQEVRNKCGDNVYSEVMFRVSQFYPSLFSSPNSWWAESTAVTHSFVG